MPAIVISLPHREDRREKLRKECEPHFSEIVFITAVRDQPGFLGCIKSHQKAVREGIKRRWDRFAVLEDDFELLHGQQLQPALETAVAAKADALYLGLDENMGFTTLRTHDSGLERVFRTCRISGAVYLSRRFMDTRIERLESCKRAIEEVQRRHGMLAMDNPRYGLVDKHRNDRSMNGLMHQFCVLTTKRRLGRQREGFSDLRLCSRIRK